ncbi:MAG TPA: DEAD/DEAH box helicase [Desulfobacteraceae bacterium]|nr:DEAD/DEAH box helicase [Desulfobacteraceae bacterium]HPJ67241.1 DEAD/DEAH box helicase [Desulfobacteraceae bacterium]
MEFSEFSLDQDIIRGISEAGFKECLPVQEKTFYHTLKGEDVCVQSQTGSGKTAAFLVSIFQALAGRKRNRKCLIIAPTRELAVQIEEEARLLGRFLNLKIGCFYGGVGYRKQEKLLEKGGIDIIIGTPGRLIDFGKQDKIRFSEIEILVIDEADRLFDMGFLPDIRWMLKRMPKYSERQTMLFSATLSSRTRQIAWEHMNEPFEIILNPDRVTVDTISQVIYHVESTEKMSLLLGILKTSEKGNALIFTNTKNAAFMVANRLEHNGYRTKYLIGDLPQNKRQENVEDFKSGRLQYLVATDVAARGLHIDNLDLVVNYDLPENPENYVHRIGRTGRTGKSGRAVTLACEEFVLGLEPLEAFIDMKIPVVWAEEAFLENDASEGMHFSLHSRRNDRQPVRPRPKAGHKGRVLTGGRSPRKKAPVRTERKRSDARKEETIRINPGISDSDRLAYYSRKYGENFKVVNHQKGGNL